MKRGVIVFAVLLTLISGCSSFKEGTTVNNTAYNEQELNETEEIPPAGTPIIYEAKEVNETSGTGQGDYRPGSGGGGAGGGGGGGAGGEGSATTSSEGSSVSTPESKLSDKTICQNAQNDNLCSGLGVAYGNGYQELCCQEHGVCC